MSEELTTEQKQAAIIAEILASRVTPSETDLASITLLEANEYGDETTFVKFHKFGHIVLSDSVLSEQVMNRLVAAYIDWRTKHYKAPTDGDDLGDINDHPF
jgi:hypothetical protein